MNKKILSMDETDKILQALIIKVRAVQFGDGYPKIDQNSIALARPTCIGFANILLENPKKYYKDVFIEIAKIVNEVNIPSPKKPLLASVIDMVVSTSVHVILEKTRTDNTPLDTAISTAIDVCKAAIEAQKEFMPVTDKSKFNFPGFATGLITSERQDFTGKKENLPLIATIALLSTPVEERNDTLDSISFDNIGSSTDTNKDYPSFYTFSQNMLSFCTASERSDIADPIFNVLTKYLQRIKGNYPAISAKGETTTAVIGGIVEAMLTKDGNSIQKDAFDVVWGLFKNIPEEHLPEAAKEIMDVVKMTSTQIQKQMVKTIIRTIQSIQTEKSIVCDNQGYSLLDGNNENNPLLIQVAQAILDAETEKQDRLRTSETTAIRKEYSEIRTFGFINQLNTIFNSDILQILEWFKEYVQVDSAEHKILKKAISEAKQEPF